VQFKYGDTWQYDYSVGDHLRWGGNDIGQPGAVEVVVAGIAEVCPVCGCDVEEEFEVWIRDDRIDAVVPVSGRYKQALAGSEFGYVITRVGQEGR
jgi:hypothetical protein